MVLSGLLAAPAFAQPSFLPLAEISTAGSYLAGREAFADFDTEAAATYYVDAARNDWSNPDLVYGALEALVVDGQIGRAADMAQHLAELEPQSPLARIVLGTVALKERRYESAIRELASVKSNTFLGVTSAILAAWAEIGDKDYEQSQKILEVISRAGFDDFLRFHRALMADVAGKSDIALSEIAKSYKAQPNDMRLVEAYVRMLANDSQFSKAETVLDTFKAQSWSSPFIAGLQKAIAEKRRPGKLTPTVQAGGAELFYDIGKGLTQDGSTDFAAIYYNLGLYLTPRNDLINLAMAGIFENAKQYGRANALYNAVPRNSPYRDLAMVRAAENIEAMGDPEEAIRRLHNLALVQPDNFDVVVALGNQQRFAKNYKEAIDAYSRALKLADGRKPRNWSLYYARGIAYERDGQWPKAEADFKTALALNPNQPQVLNYLGYSWVDQGTHLQEALDMIKKAIDWDPSDGYVVDSLGWAYYRLQRYADAVATLEQAVELRPNDPEINDHLGDAYWRDGRQREARFQWGIAADLAKTGDIKTRAEEKLRNGLGPVAADTGTSSAANAQASQ